MALINNRNSILGVKVETTEGVIVPPAAVTDFVALQDDFAIDPKFNVLQNSEIKPSIAPSKSIQGGESPSASFSHYLRHSGTEGTAPDYNDFLKAAFGSEVVAANEYDATTGSSATVIKMGSGHGANFQRGQMMLIKHAAAAYEIRPVHSVATDDVTPAFATAAVVATGTTMGKCVLYAPTSTGHQTLSLWHYLGNSGALQAMCGVRPTGLSIDFKAGELINCSMDLEGIGYYFNPVVVTATNNHIDFTDDDGTVAAHIAVGTYKDPHDFAAAVTAAMAAVGVSHTSTCTYSDSTGKYTITNPGSTFSLLWNTGTNKAEDAHTLLGFAATGDKTGALTYTSDTAPSLAAAYTPTLDSADPLCAKDNLVLIGDAANSTAFAASQVSVKMSMDKKNLDDVNSVSGVSGSLINARKTTVSVKALLNQYDADKFKRFRQNTETRFFYAFGTKSGGNWVAGKCGGIYCPTMTITKFQLGNDDGLISLDMDLEAYAGADGLGEVYLGFV